jgi:hypothetical protein
MKPDEARKAEGVGTGALWRPIDENTPRGELLLYWPAYTDRNGRNFLSPMMRVDYNGHTPHRKPTHWMPLPEPPL